ncbi:MAG TPA: hypothetical protein HA364_03935 [Thermoplasmata archaeon]|nr:hypothetical protein [Thermoplasmata archaeon]
MRREGKEFLHFHVGRWLYVLKRGQEMPQQPSDFAMMLRKRVTNARLAGVRQQGFDRIVVLTLEKGGDPRPRPRTLRGRHCHTREGWHHSAAAHEPHLEAQGCEGEEGFRIPPARTGPGHDGRQRAVRHTVGIRLRPRPHTRDQAQHRRQVQRGAVREDRVRRPDAGR